jgi:hypothetical protein
MPLDLFSPVVPVDRQHPVFQLLMRAENQAERDVVSSWAADFDDRDGKFVQEFQLTFESSFWELYIYAALKVLGLKTDFSFSSPDFVVPGSFPLAVEATIAGPAQGESPAYGYGMADIPDDLTAFNIAATLRVCNAFSAKVKRFRNSYSTMKHVVGRPYVISIGAFDRPMSHLASGRPILAALYGLYHDEEATPPDAKRVIQYNVTAAPKSPSVNIPVGLFCDDTHSEVSAVIYSSLATWGKLRAIADKPGAPTVFRTMHPKRGQLLPELRISTKAEYREHLLDGLWVLHNPFAKHPIPDGVLSHPRVAEVRIAPDGELLETVPEDFLLVRMVNTLIQPGTAGSFPTEFRASNRQRKP